MKAIQACNPQSNDFLNYQTIYPLALHYGLNFDVLQTECHLAKHTCKNKELQSIRDFLEQTIAFDSAFSELKQ